MSFSTIPRWLSRPNYTLNIHNPPVLCSTLSRVTCYMYIKSTIIPLKSISTTSQQTFKIKQQAQAVFGPERKKSPAHVELGKWGETINLKGPIWSHQIADYRSCASPTDNDCRQNRCSDSQLSLFFLASILSCCATIESAAWGPKLRQQLVKL